MMYKPKRDRGRWGRCVMKEAAMQVVRAACAKERPSSDRAMEDEVDGHASRYGKHHCLGWAKPPAHPCHRPQADEQYERNVKHDKRRDENVLKRKACTKEDGLLHPHLRQLLVDHHRCLTERVARAVAQHGGEGVVVGSERRSRGVVRSCAQFKFGDDQLELTARQPGPMAAPAKIIVPTT
eukprot:scaffold170281_cov29-Tisochrysis_lutea.AAC.6